MLALEPALPDYPVFSFVRVAQQMPHVRDILHIENVIPEETKIPYNYVKRNIAFCMTEVRVAVDGRSAHIYADVVIAERSEIFF
jgi:hypothetical protein